MKCLHISPETAAECDLTYGHHASHFPDQDAPFMHSATIDGQRVHWPHSGQPDTLRAIAELTIDDLPIVGVGILRKGFHVDLQAGTVTMTIKAERTIDVRYA